MACHRAPRAFPKGLSNRPFHGHQKNEHHENGGPEMNGAPEGAPFAVEMRPAAVQKT